LFFSFWRWPRCRIRFAHMLTSLHLILTCLIEKARGPRDLGVHPRDPSYAPHASCNRISFLSCLVLYPPPTSNLLPVCNQNTSRVPSVVHLTLLTDAASRSDLPDKARVAFPDSNVLLYSCQSRPCPCASGHCTASWPARCRSRRVPTCTG
jgi:hypothetical protein